jgi:hypothetical protein
VARVQPESVTGHYAKSLARVRYWYNAKLPTRLTVAEA